MDIKVAGITEEIMKVALAQAKDGRAHILGEMAKALDHTREELSAHAPRIETMQIPKDKIREVIGTGGKVIREIVADDRRQGRHRRRGRDQDQLVRPVQIEAARQWIRGIVAEPEPGTIYTGKVASIVDFGAFVTFMPGKDGLVHVSRDQERAGRERPRRPDAKARRSRSSCSRSTSAARSACRCASSTRKPARSSPTPAPRANRAKAATAARAAIVAIAATVAAAATAIAARAVKAAAAAAVEAATATVARAAKAVATAARAAKAAKAAATTGPAPEFAPAFLTGDKED